MTDWLEADEGCLADTRWPMAPTHLLPLERWLWWEQLWTEVVMLRRRYRLVPAKDWWEDPAKVEALAALDEWVARYDSGEWDDPPGKLALLYDLERVRQLVRGHEPFDPARDHAAFARFLVEARCQAPPSDTRSRRQQRRTQE
jgi:hypothetical protein